MGAQRAHGAAHIHRCVWNASGDGAERERVDVVCDDAGVQEVVKVHQQQADGGGAMGETEKVWQLMKYAVALAARPTGGGGPGECRRPAGAAACAPPLGRNSQQSESPVRGTSHGCQRCAGQQSGHRAGREKVHPTPNIEAQPSASGARRRSYTRGSEVGDRCRPSLKP